MSADTADDADSDALESRIAALEATTAQMNERLGRVEDEIRELRSEMNDLRDSVRNWAVFTVLALGTLLTIFQFLP